MKKEKWYEFKRVDNIFGVPVKYFLPAALLMIIAGRLGWVPEDLFITAIALIMAVGGLLSWIGEITPVLKAIGGKLLLPLLGTSLLVKYGILSPIFTESADLFAKNGFQMLFVAAVVAGSILATDSRFLKACVIRYIPVLIISQIFALGFSFLAAFLTGRGAYEAVFFVAAPCMTGGTSGAISTLPSLYSSVLGTDMSGMAAQLYAVALVGTYLSLIITIVLNILAKRFPKAMGNGNGELIRSATPALQKAKENAVTYEASSADYGELITVLSSAYVSAPCYTAGDVPEQHLEILSQEICEKQFGIFSTWGVHTFRLEPVLMLAPPVAKVFAEHGLSKQDVRDYLWRESHVTAAQMERHWQDFNGLNFDMYTRAKTGKIPPVYGESDDPERLIPVFLNNRSLQIIVAGDPARAQSKGFMQSGYIAPPVSRKVALPKDYDAMLEEMKRH